MSDDLSARLGKLAAQGESCSLAPEVCEGDEVAMTSLFGPADEGTCDAYRACRDHGTKADARAFLEHAWNRLGHLVGDRQQHFLAEFRSNFHAKSWELYLLDVLSAASCVIEPGKPEGPDICATVGGKRVWIEAVVPTPGAPESPDRVFQRPSGPWAGALYPEAALLVRYRSVLEEKLKKIDRYLAKGVIATTDAVLIAVNQGAILDSDLHDAEVPAIVKAVFPIGETVMVVTPYSAEAPRVEIPPRFSVTKKKGAEVSTTLFLEPRSAAVSGVLFASQVVWNLQKAAENDLSLVHNPQAKTPLPLRSLPLKCELWVEDEELRHEGKWSGLG